MQKLPGGFSETSGKAAGFIDWAMVLIPEGETANVFLRELIFP